MKEYPMSRLLPAHPNCRGRYTQGDDFKRLQIGQEERRFGQRQRLRQIGWRNDRWYWFDLLRGISWCWRLGFRGWRRDWDWIY